VGLFRTEFLFSGREQPPSEAEQSQLYAETLALLGDRPLVVRTLDVGGDKPIPYLGIVPEANPFLGLRGIRYSLSQPDLFAAQLRALLRAGAAQAASRGSQPLRIMLPMVSQVEEVQRARQLLGEAEESLAGEGIQPLPSVQLGIMIEVPAAVVLAPELARHVDFFSIGTNDLSQYVMAADRTNPAVAHLADARHPAILRMIRQTVAAAKEAGIKVSVCGALAGDPQAAAILVGLGVDELSMAAPAIPPVKAALREVSLADCREMAHSAIE
jgi:phosphocarrier protein FPr